MAAQTDTTDARETTSCRESDLPGREGSGLGADQRARLLLAVLAKDGGKLERFARRMAASQADAEDLMQQACLHFHTAYPGGANPAGWLYVTIRHESIRHHRRRQARQEVTLHSHPGKTGESHGLEAVLEHDGLPVEELIARREETRFVGRALSRLTPDQRRALLLLGYGYTYREIREITGWPKAKLNHCLSKGRASARRQITEWETA